MKLIYGIGINDADYTLKIREELPKVNGKRKQKLIWQCPFYLRWIHMLRRCYCQKYLKEHPTYQGCSVCEEWLTFSNFKKWMEQQDWEGKQLDKDILGDGKLYSPETCCFIDQATNKFLTDNKARRGKYKVGVTFHKRDQVFVAQCCCYNYENSKYKNNHLGYFDSEEDAHMAWLLFKLKQSNVVAAHQSDKKVAKAIVDRFERLVYEHERN
jgi:hypothetical protein